MSLRKIIHVDMDAFFASVEQRDNPELRGKPVAVGGNGERGVIAAASYEARKFGVRSAMPSITAKKLCPNLIFVRHRFDAYKEASREIREVFYEYTDLVEPLSLDEAFLDVTRNHQNIPSATLIAKEIVKSIYAKTGLTASAGISVNKFLAKVASDLHKPSGITLIAPEHIDEFIAELSIDDFFGVGKVTSAKMKSMGIFKGLDLQRYTRPELVRLFGKTGGYYFNICRGLDDRKVRSERVIKSISTENTFAENLTNIEGVNEKVQSLIEDLIRRLGDRDIKGKTLTLKIKYSDFKIQTRSKSLDEYFNDIKTISIVANELMMKAPLENDVRLLGIGLSNLNLPSNEERGQLTLEF